MRILQISSAKNLGGGETHLLELTRMLREHGHEVLLAGRPGSAIEPDVELPFLNSIDIVTSWRLRRLLRRQAFDIVHAHVARDYTVTAAACWGLPTKVVMTRHLLYPVHRHALYRRVDGWIAPTPEILGTLEPLQPKRAVVIPNWVDVEKFQYRPRRTLRQPINVGVLGQISPHKGHGDALEAIRILGSNYRLLIGGKGESDYVAALKRTAHGLPVDFLGFVSLPDFFEMVDILLVPSWHEPFGIVLLEAMASGIPLVSTSAGGPLTIVRPNQDGTLVPPRDPAALARAVQEVAAGAERRAAMVQSARERVEAEFDIRAVVPRVERFYESVRNA